MTVGEEYEVRGANASITIKGHPFSHLSKLFELVVGSPFKVGDKVKVVSETEYSCLKVGSIFEVTDRDDCKTANTAVVGVWVNHQHLELVTVCRQCEENEAEGACDVCGEPICSDCCVGMTSTNNVDYPICETCYDHDQ